MRYVFAGRGRLPQSHPKRFLVSRSGIAGFPQLYLRDPDLNVVEIDGAHSTSLRSIHETVQTEISGGGLC